jgi:hypothetical protein
MTDHTELLARAEADVHRRVRVWTPRESRLARHATELVAALRATITERDQYADEIINLYEDVANAEARVAELEDDK